MTRSYRAAVGDATRRIRQIFIVTMPDVQPNLMHDRPQLTPGLCWTGRGGLARDAGVDIIVAQGWEAGGHVRGTVANLLPNCG
jgi:hypothetical protein